MLEVIGVGIVVYYLLGWKKQRSQNASDSKSDPEQPFMSSLSWSLCLLACMGIIFHKLPLYLGLGLLLLVIDYFDRA
ncbi:MULTISPECIES: hypothetical protein [Aerococcus]|uniref:Uncharacterized protein n=1 Tax=Aerococcus tenax TaxID=3078812 RepID=A0A5N1BLI8_9LACT|nr:hypothetical protein [Aerococcus urinae]KAA9239461.1 hypothetical protein F6I34_06685 [Aerococcus urinae]MDK6370523.1 hypothetical protein [Aerococcus urinae]MDK6596805.1 hypothetical protein [Aerococcus urinae]MDK7302269.1 hypothetical protein [Aerococcus urinae]MDK7800779.1 hypothetical protein [Aerococcus urinae]